MIAITYWLEAALNATLLLLGAAFGSYFTWLRMRGRK